MEMTKRNKILIVLAIVIVIIIIIVKLVVDNNRTLLGHGLVDDYKSIYKKYGVNEYSVINISDEQLANIYLNNFKYYLINDIEYAYNLLDEEYRNIRFGSIEKFSEYLNNIKYSDFSIEEYSVGTDKRFIKIDILNNEKIIFKINGVLDYSVYLDDYTVEIS